MTYWMTDGVVLDLPELTAPGGEAAVLAGHVLMDISHHVANPPAGGQDARSLGVYACIPLPFADAVHAQVQAEVGRLYPGATVKLAAPDPLRTEWTWMRVAIPKAAFPEGSL